MAKSSPQPAPIQRQQALGIVGSLFDAACGEQASATLIDGFEPCVVAEIHVQGERPGVRNLARIGKHPLEGHAQSEINDDLEQARCGELLDTRPVEIRAERVEEGNAAMGLARNGLACDPSDPFGGRGFEHVNRASFAELGIQPERMANLMFKQLPENKPRWTEIWTEVKAA